MVALAACGGTVPQAGTEPQETMQTGPSVVDDVTVFVGGHETGGDAPEALVSGEVVVDDGCLMVVEPDGADGSVPLFPQGTVIEPGTEGPVVRTPVGELTVGDNVGLGGGFIGGLDDDLGECNGVARSGGFSVFSIEHDLDP